jgi:hypothetical protein
MIYSPAAYGPSPILEWFFGPENTSLPSDVVVSNVTIVTLDNNSNYTSTLQFSPLYKRHTGIYTCRIGYSAASTIILVGGKDRTICTTVSGCIKGTA